MSSSGKRKGASKLPKRDDDAIVNALKAVKISQQSVRAVAKSFNIARTSLQRYILSFEATGKDIKQMADAELKVFVESLATHGTHTLV